MGALIRCGGGGSCVQQSFDCDSCSEAHLNKVDSYVQVSLLRDQQSTLMSPLCLLMMPHCSSQKQRVAPFSVAAASLVTFTRLHALGAHSLFCSCRKHAPTLRYWLLLHAHRKLIYNSTCRERERCPLSSAAGYRRPAAHVSHRLRGDIWPRRHSARLRHVSSKFGADVMPRDTLVLQRRGSCADGQPR